MDAIALRVAARFKFASSDPLAEDVEAKGTSKGWEKRRERDDFTEQNIPPEYLLLWRKLKTKFKGTPHERAQHFMEYVEEHPGENMEALQEHADKDLAQMSREWEKKRREQRQIEKDCDKNKAKYDKALTKEHDRATKEQNNLQQLKEKAEGVCQACPTCDVTETPGEYRNEGVLPDDGIPFAASHRVLAHRVLARFRTARWDNAMNGRFFSLHWNKAKYHLEEMADGSPMPASVSFGESGPAMIAWEFPQLTALFSKFDTPVHPSPGPDRTYMRFPGEASGAEARKIILDGSEKYLQEVLAAYKEDPANQYVVERLEHVILPQVRKKLVWKKVRT